MFLTTSPSTRYASVMKKVQPETLSGVYLSHSSKVTTLAIYAMLFPCQENRFRNRIQRTLYLAMGKPCSLLILTTFRRLGHRLCMIQIFDMIE